MLVASCKREAPESAAPRLYLETEIATYQADLKRRLDENAKRTCPAPRVVAEAAVVPGPSAPAQYALVQPVPGSPLAACAVALTGIDFKTATPPLTAESERCAAAYETAMHEVAAHATGCSAFQVGVHPMPAFMPLMQAVRLLAYRARWTADAGGDPTASMVALVDALRVVQDQSRGHVLLINAMMQMALTNIIGEQMQYVLAKKRLAPAQLDELAGALDRLIAATPPFLDAMEGERDYTDAAVAMAQLDPSWVMPGGLGDDPPPAADGSSHWGDARDEATVVFDAGATRIAAIMNVCPRTGTLAACRDGLAAKPVAPLAMDDLASTYLKFTSATAEELEVRRQQVRGDIVANLLAMFGSIGEYVGKEARAVARLAWLRLYVEVLRTGACPTERAIDNATIGEPLTFTVEKGVATLVVPTWMMLQPPDSTWTFSCP